jgi:glycosyltransferase involved in cell wall biosynthesis
LYISSRHGDKLAHKMHAALPANVRVMGWVPDDELIRSYQRSRFVVVPLEDTTHSGAGINGVLEASALGKAVIGTDTGGMRTFIKDGETGILVPPYDVEALRKAICTLWTQPELCYQMGQAGRQYVARRFSPEDVKADIMAHIAALYTGEERQAV